MRIGPYQIDPALALAPMAGVTDKPFRLLCKRLGAGLAVSEMTHSDPRLWQTRKSRTRMDHQGEPAPIAVQIAGYDPAMLAEAARFNVAQGAQIIDINMGCPAKKVCNVWSGSALMQNEALVADILKAVVAAVPVPVTLKMRTGWNHQNRNAPVIARIAEDAGIAALIVHGRTRVDMYEGEAEYDTIAEIKASVRIPVAANGDVVTPEKAKQILQHTGADALWIGRAAQGNPWIFREITHYLKTGLLLPRPSRAERCETLLGHVRALHQFYGEQQGLRIARKHIGWYLKAEAGTETVRQQVNASNAASEQLDLLASYFEQEPMAVAA
ncbi:tRNA dihydrouridine synthase DusB [Ahniella affigens]|uniref:tRNA-dihydrouridine synthase B n=1 Tax=Ahniella affigens TaxID=2021234 RepID=A0A2P1PNL8_9GAMM|nr:tRNA dihydrouridine synthase DusB [Ahniella affigens]AVP96438.1 tRNA dihydrouridine synthase DusB [Ahniella affigens]